jgi:hypothetical protein
MGTLSKKLFFPIEAQSSDNESVLDYPLERRAWATDREPARRARPLIARLGSISGAVCRGTAVGPGLFCAFARTPGIAVSRIAKSEYFRIVLIFVLLGKAY